MEKSGLPTRFRYDVPLLPEENDSLPHTEGGTEVAIATIGPESRASEAVVSAPRRHRTILQPTPCNELQDFTSCSDGDWENGWCERHLAKLRKWERRHAPAPLCGFPGCGRPHRARGWCAAHYRQWTRAGRDEERLLPLRAASPTECLHPGCERGQHAIGLCSMHYQRYRRHGTSAYVRTRTTPKDAMERLQTYIHCRQRFGAAKNCQTKEGEVLIITKWKAQGRRVRPDQLPTPIVNNKGLRLYCTHQLVPTKKGA